MSDHLVRRTRSFIKRTAKQENVTRADGTVEQREYLQFATGQTLDFSGFYVWLTSNIGSAELMSLQHSSEATLERHVLTRAQQSLRPEIFARINEKLVFHRLAYDHQLEIAEKFLARQIAFLGERGHRLDRGGSPFCNM